jgi:hypothetical protein
MRSVVYIRTFYRDTVIKGKHSAMPVPPKPVETAFELKIELLHESTLVGGMYLFPE